MQHLLNVHFYAPRLWERVRERPAMLYFVFNSDIIAVLVAHDLQRGEMVAQVTLRDASTPLPQPHQCTQVSLAVPQRAHVSAPHVPALHCEHHRLLPLVAARSKASSIKLLLEWRC